MKVSAMREICCERFVGTKYNLLKSEQFVEIRRNQNNLLKLEEIRRNRVKCDRFLILFVFTL